MSCGQGRAGEGGFTRAEGRTTSHCMHNRRCHYRATASCAAQRCSTCTPRLWRISGSAACSTQHAARARQVLWSVLHMMMRADAAQRRIPYPVPRWKDLAAPRQPTHAKRYAIVRHRQGVTCMQLSVPAPPLRRFGRQHGLCVAGRHPQPAAAPACVHTVSGPTPRARGLRNGRPSSSAVHHVHRCARALTAVHPGRSLPRRGRA